jgi:hypothetical protein
MRRHVKPALRHSATATGNIVTQVFVGVTTALLVALITNAAFVLRDHGGAFEPAGMTAFGEAPAAQPGIELPPLEMVVIEDVPQPLSQPAATDRPGGLYYAENEPMTDPLQLLTQAGT